MKTLGVIGGAGPMATAYFMRLVIEMTDAKTDQDHLKILIDNNPKIPDRTGFILDRSKEDPEPVMLAMGRGLKENGAEILAIPCITASYFIPRLQEKLGIPVIDTISETADHLKRQGVTSVGLLATDGTITTGIFQKKLEEAGIQVLLPDQRGQQQVMDVIYQKVKAGKAVGNELHIIKDDLQKRGAEYCILGCTELSVAAIDRPMEYGWKNGYVDALKILAESSIVSCGAKLK